MDQLKDRLILTSDHCQEIIEIAKLAKPLEACGLIAGLHRQSKKVIQITNVVESAVVYKMSGPELVNALWEIEAEGWSLLAFFHSHPASPPIPSVTDLSEHHYPEVPQIIVGYVDHKWEMAAYTLTSQSFTEISIRIT